MADRDREISRRLMTRPQSASLAVRSLSTRMFVNVRSPQYEISCMDKSDGLCDLDHRC
jgi:hypothetical protein